ncbi:MAG: TraB/GumN family protein [Ectothiorhodospiraceae bacterium]|jgi:uncharacterized protein YbaP (TraB family)
MSAHSRFALGARRHLAVAAAVCLGLTLLNAAPAAAGTERGLIFRLDGEHGKPSWLVGSMHMGKRSLYPLPYSIKSAAAKSDTLVLEADIRGGGTAQAALFVRENGVYPPGDGLDQELGQKRWQKVAAAADHLEIPREVIVRQRPWLASNTITLAVLHHAGWSEQLGIEAYLIREVGPKRPVLQLESIAAQLRLLSGMSEAEQERLLMASVTDMDSFTQQTREFVDAWKAGDLDAFYKALLEQFPDDAQGLKKRLLDDRNATMTERIRGLLADGRSHLIVVGGGHLAGPQGIVQRLRDSGVEVEQE